MSTPTSSRLVEIATPNKRPRAYEPMLTLEGVVKHFPAGRGKTVHSVDGVSLEVGKGEVLGLVGESGCGKSTLARTILQAVSADSGHITFDGEKISGATGKKLKALRSAMQFVFQDPYGAFDPKMRLRTSMDAPRHHGMKDKAERAARIAEMVTRVGLRTTSWTGTPGSAPVVSFSGW